MLNPLAVKLVLSNKLQKPWPQPGSTSANSSFVFCLALVAQLGFAENSDHI